VVFHTSDIQSNQDLKTSMGFYRAIKKDRHIVGNRCHQIRPNEVTLAQLLTKRSQSENAPRVELQDTAAGPGGRRSPPDGRCSGQSPRAGLVVQNASGCQSNSGWEACEACAMLAS